ncbi:hypothetical protein KI387_000049, partial [Taxus chinensis]
MASEIPRWKASPKKRQEQKTENSSHSAEYFSNKKLAHLGFTELSTNERGSTYINAISNPDEVTEIGTVELAGSIGKMSNFNSDYSFGVWLTWKDVWVTVSDPREGSKILVQGLTGYAQPGHMVAIMGPSGSGKSTLLDALAGRLGGATRQAGDILVNGRRQALSYGTSAYVTQDDILMATLTVGEAVFYSAQLQLPDNMSAAEKRQRAEITIKQMGLNDSVNTRIGGWRMKGLSGGQKRRVSIAIEILTRPPLLFLDEPTSGLDSAAAYHVMKRIATLARDDGRTVIASIYQPSDEVFDLFDNLYLLAGGRTVYFGEAFQASEEGVTLEIKGSQASFVMQSYVLTKRSFVNMYRDLGYYWLRVAIYIALRLCVGTIYFNVRQDYGAIQARGAMLMFVVAFLTFMAIGGFPSFVEDMKGVMMLNGGFFRLPNDLPKPFWRYPMYYIAFHKYANQAFYKNDFSGLNFTNNQVGASPIRGDDILRDTWQVEMGYSKWVDLLILGGMVMTSKKKLEIQTSIQIGLIYVYYLLRGHLWVNKVLDNGNVFHEGVDVTRFGIDDRHQLIEKSLHISEEDNEQFLIKIQDRIDSVGIDLPKIEVRLEQLMVDAK